MICEICGKEFNEPMYMAEYENVCSSKCFSKKFWKDTLNDDAIIINHICYHIGSPSYPNGFGGEKFRIRMLGTGEIIEANGTLWCNGEIPEEFLVPDNAEFIRITNESHLSVLDPTDGFDLFDFKDGSKAVGTNFKLEDGSRVAIGAGLDPASDENEVCVILLRDGEEPSYISVNENLLDTKDTIKLAETIAKYVHKSVNSTRDFSKLINYLRKIGSR